MNWLQKTAQVLKVPELRQKIFFVLSVFVLFRVLAAVPVPGINLLQLRAFFDSNEFFGLINLFTGGSLDNLSIVMLGLGPYITAVIIMQLLTMMSPKLKELQQKEGEQGRRRFNQIGRYLTVPLAIIQGYSFLTLLQSQNILTSLTMFDMVTNITILTAGALLMVWLGELVTEKGIGNGVSLLIFAGIISALPSSIGQVISTFDQTQIPSLIAYAVVAVGVIAGVVFMNEAQRQIPISYAKRQTSRSSSSGATSYLPLKVNQAGVIPIIFGLSIMLFPQLISSFLSQSEVEPIRNFAIMFGNIFSDPFVFAGVYFTLVVLFAFFYTSIQFDPRNISENLQKNGGFVPGIRPGQPTTEYLTFVVNRITFVGALFLGLVAVLPNVMQQFTGIQSLTVGGTAILIIVSVVLETVKQIRGQLVMRDYDKY